MTRRVVMIAYNFPPIGGIGVQRTLKYATYLPRFGWTPVVVTAKNPGYALRDSAVEDTVPSDLAVLRAASPEPVKLRRALGAAAKGLLSAGRGARGPQDVAAAPSAAGAGTSVSAPGISAPGVPAPGKGRAQEAWERLVAELFFPDEQLGWVPFAIRLATSAARSPQADAIYSSASPISCHVAAAIVAERTGLPWIADFRDPWIGNGFAPPLPRWQRPLQRWFERWIVDHAARVVFATPGFLEGYRERYPWAADRFVAIPNGYDRNDFPPAVRAAIEASAAAAEPGNGPQPPSEPTPEAGRRFHLVFGGSVYGEHELATFLDGVELLLARRPELRERLDIEFVGWLTLHNQQVAARYTTPDRLGGVVRFSGFVPHPEALARLASADALLQIITADRPNKWRIAGGKLTEYVGLDRPILAAVPDGEARAVLRELDWGLAVDPTPAAIAEGIEQIMAAPRPSRRADPEGRYDRVNLAGRMAALLDEVVAERRRE